MNPPVRTTRSRWWRRSRAGLTFVEVIVSLGIVAGGAALVFGALGFMSNVIAHDRNRLNGTEVAHRVVLMYIDDFKQLRGQVHRVEQGGTMYQFDVWEEVLASESGVDPRAARTSASQRRKSIKAEQASVEERLSAQIHQITVHVYAEMPDGSRSARPVATLVRSYNPIMGLGARGLSYFAELYKQSTGRRVIE